MNRPYLWLILAGLIVAVGAPLAGNWWRRQPEHSCRLDRAKIVALYRVSVVDQQDQTNEFCCIRCAELWLSNQEVKSRAIYVTDEASGQPIGAATAYFVRSPVVTTATTQNRIHAFATRSDAEKHLERYGGQMLQGEDRPFSRPR
jgi:hypothetical protein